MIRERRKNRSEKVFSAMQKQLKAIAVEGDFQTALISDRDGLVIAASHESPLNASLSVLGSPYLRNEDMLKLYNGKTFILKNRIGAKTIIGSLFTLLGQPVLFLALGSKSGYIQPLVSRAVTGTKRIVEQN